jgi:hypothetical protein
MNNMPVKWLALIVMALLTAACGPRKELADKVVSDVETSVGAIRTDAEKFAPTELQQVDTAIASLKDTLAKGDYKAVVDAAPGVSSQVSALQQTVSAKRREATAAMAVATDQWKALSAEVPDMLSAIQSRVDVLGQSRKLPKNVTADAFQSAKDGFEFMKTTWAEATSQFGSGDPVSAVAKGQSVKDKGAEVLKLLGMG